MNRPAIVVDRLGVGALICPTNANDPARFRVAAPAPGDLDLVVTEMRDVGTDTQAVVAAWRAGDAAKLASLLGDEYKSFPALYRTLVGDRNKRWVPQIEKLLKDKDNYFVVVGALHLVGDGGLLELMRRDGFKAEQLN